MSENFGLKIGLEGEKEFKKSLAEINNSFKILGSEMKLVDSQFDKNDKSTEALTARSEVLNKEIDSQKQKIETLRSALANAAESFGENDRRTQSWQIQLNNAQAALNGMERELNSNNTALEKADKGFDEAGDEAKDFSNSVKKAADTSEDADGKLSKLGDTAKKIGAALGAAAAAVGTACVAAGKKLWDMANDVGSAGDQIDKTSQKIGISAESYQKWGYVFERCGADVNNLQTGMKKLSTVITDAAGGSDSAAEKLFAVGLSIEELNGKSQDEQLSMVITALQGMEAGAERTAAANDLLGKSAVDMAAVLNTSVEETERLKQEAEDYGMVMSNEAVAASAAFEDSLTKLSHTAGGLKNRMVGELLPGITQITDGLADLLAGNEQAADELKNGVTSVIDTIRTLIPQFAELITSIAGAVLESAPGIIKALADGLLSAISELIPTLARIVTEIISALVGLLPQIVSAGADILLSLIKGIADTIPQLVPQIVAIVVEIVKTLVDNLPLILDAALQLITGLAQGILDSLPILIEALPQIIMGIVDFLIGAIPQIIEAGIQLLTALVTALPDIITAIVEVIPQIIDGIITLLQTYGVGFKYERISNSSSQYRWFYGAGVNGDYCNALSAFEWDDKYFVITKYPLIDGKEATGTNNFGQLRIFTKDGKSTGKTWQYVADGTLSNMTAASFWGFYVDEKTNTPLVICDSCNISYSLLALEIIKSGEDYGRYRMRFSAPTYGNSYLYSYANLIKTDGLNLPLYILPYYPYSSNSQHFFGFALGICKLCLTTINNLSEPVRKLDGQVMKITYDIVDE